MQFDLEPGDFVVNPNNKEWGTGQIQSIIKNKITKHVFENYEKPKNYEHLADVHRLLHKLKYRNK